MALNEARIKKQVKRAIAIKPTSIDIKRDNYISNGYNSTIYDSTTTFKTIDVFIDDVNTNKQNSFFLTENRDLKTFNRVFMYATVEPEVGECILNSIEINDYFFINDKKYVVLNNAQPVKDVYICEMEVLYND